MSMHIHIHCQGPNSKHNQWRNIRQDIHKTEFWSMGTDKGFPEGGK